MSAGKRKMGKGGKTGGASAGEELAQCLALVSKLLEDVQHFTGAEALQDKEYAALYGAKEPLIDVVAKLTGLLIKIRQSEGEAVEPAVLAFGAEDMEILRRFMERTEA